MRQYCIVSDFTSIKLKDFCLFYSIFILVSFILLPLNDDNNETKNTKLNLIVKNLFQDET